MVIKAINKKQMVKASILERSFATTVKKKLGPFIAPDKRKHQKPRKSYGEKPITRHKATRKLWKQFRERKNTRRSLTRKAFSCWKEFLKLEAINDPLAIAIIQAQKELLKVLMPGRSKKRELHRTDLER